MTLPKAALMLKHIEIRHRFKQFLMGGALVVRWEKTLKTAAVPEHLELFFGLPVGGWQHQQQHA